MDLKTFIDTVKNLNGKKIDLDRWNEQIQVNIVKSTSNQLLLAYFVNNSKYKYIHYRALDKIDDEDILMDITLNNRSKYWGDYGFMMISSYLDPAYYNSEKAFSKINDKYKLIEIVKSIDHELYNLRHLKKFIDDDDIWADIARDANMDYHKIFALKQIRNKNVFVDTVAKCDIDKILKKANYIKDDWFERRTEAITDEDYLKSIVQACQDDDEESFEKIDDDDFFKKVFLTYKNRHVRALAIKQITEEDFLKELAREEDSDVRRRAMENIHDENFLKSVALNDEDWKVRAYAVENIHDENFLKSVALDDEDWSVRAYAVENIHDENFLKSVALNDENWIIRRHALENIHDENFLKSVALNDENSDVRRHALENISDINLLKSFISHRKEVFEELTDRIDDEDFWKGIVMDDENYSNKERLYALKNIRDIDFLRHVALNDFREVCLYASLKTGEYDIIKQKTYVNFPKNLLYETLHDNINNEIAIELMEYVDGRDVTSFIEEMTDDEIFLAVLDKMCPDIYYDCDREVFKNRLRKISDEVLLKYIFLNGKNEKLMRWAASKVDDEEFFKDIFFKSDESWFKAIALENIHDQDLLCDVAENSKDYLLKSSALVNIVDGDVLKSIYFNADSDDQKDFIISKTDDVDICTDYAFTGREHRLRMTASQRITDENVLKDLFFKEPDYWVRDVFSKNIHDDDFFLEILHGNYDKELKSVNLGVIENKENLVKMAHDFTYPDLSKRAINLIKDYSVLRDICERTPTCESDDEIIEHARKHLYDLFFKSEAQLYTHGG